MPTIREKVNQNLEARQNELKQLKTEYNLAKNVLFLKWFLVDKVDNKALYLKIDAKNKQWFKTYQSKICDTKEQAYDFIEQFSSWSIPTLVNDSWQIEEIVVYDSLEDALTVYESTN